ncbi:hypothetical protein FQN49_004249 [Arthroderma sp. PD_2]|nr:hypothetical protein FQN49_004249 [Arthroderma sp. PD_2]
MAHVLEDSEPTRPVPPRRSENSSNWRQKEPSSAVGDAPRPTKPIDRSRWNAPPAAPAPTHGNIRGFRGWDSPTTRTSKEPGSRYHESPPTSTSRSSTTPIHPAIVEGRRLYVGSMPYMAKKEDVVELFQGSKDLIQDGKDGSQGESSPYKIERIDISIDPFTGRNPSYCFVDLETADQAQRAMAELNGRPMLGRPVKINPGVPRSDVHPPLGRRDPTVISASKQHSYPQKFAFERWTRDDASDHWYGYAAEGRRLFVGGLPRMRDQPTVDYEIRKVFYGFNIEAISKVIISNRDKLPLSGSQYYYLFVDLESAEEADKALKVLNGVSAIYGNRLHMNKARGDSRKPPERDRWRDKNEKKEEGEKKAHLLDAPIDAEGIAQSLV